VGRGAHDGRLSKGSSLIQDGPTRNRGFTLIEVMITVSIVGILAAIALPEYDQLLQRSKRAEIPLNLDGVRLVEQGYLAEWGEYTSCVLKPDDVPGRKQVPFPATMSTDMDWNELGWVPDGKVYGQYGVEAIEIDGELVSFVADGFADIDGDGNLANYQATHLVKPVLLTSNNVY